MTTKIEHVRRIMMENGLDRFYWTFAKFRAQICLRIDFDVREQEMMQMLNFDQLFFFFVIYAIQMIVAIVVFTVEMIGFRFRGARNDVDGIE